RPQLAHAPRRGPRGRRRPRRGPHRRHRDDRRPRPPLVDGGALPPPRGPGGGVLAASHRPVRVRRDLDPAGVAPLITVPRAADGSSLQMIDDYARASAAAGGFDHADAALIRLSMTLDAKGWQQLAKACKRLYEQAQRIEADARERLDGAAGEEEELNVGLVM